MAIVNEDIPQTDGPNASMPQGDATQIQKQIKSVQSQARGAPSGLGKNAPAGGGMPGGQPQGQPSGQPVQPPPEKGRLNMNAVFPQMPQMNQQPPWRDVLRAAANHPNAGPALRSLAALIEKQNGPSQ